MGPPAITAGPCCGLGPSPRPEVEKPSWRACFLVLPLGAHPAARQGQDKGHEEGKCGLNEPWWKAAWLSSHGSFPCLEGAWQPGHGCSQASSWLGRSQKFAGGAFSGLNQQKQRLSCDHGGPILPEHPGTVVLQWKSPASLLQLQGGIYLYRQGPVRLSSDTEAPEQAQLIGIWFPGHAGTTDAASSSWCRPSGIWLLNRPTHFLGRIASICPAGLNRPIFLFPKTSLLYS